MVKLEDYLYNGDTIFKILQRYTDDLEASALKNNNQIDLMHANFLASISELLEHNAFLTSQSNRIKEFYMYMAEKYPYLAFTLKGRIKSIIRSEEKFNGYIVDYIYNYYNEFGRYPEVPELKDRLKAFRDLIAYRIVISLPKCHVAEDEDKRTSEIDLLYEIAGALPQFLEKRDFSLVSIRNDSNKTSEKLDADIAGYFRDYIVSPGEFGYQSLHITVYDNLARCYIELQLRTKDMDDYAEIGPANHIGYEKRQEAERARRSAIPVGECKYFDEAYERVVSLQQLDLSKLDVNMFSAVDNSLINDCCGLYRGRLILPFEHLSRFQNE